MSKVTRLDRLRIGNVGNLGFLPIEICNKIYTFLLAEFRPTEVQQCDDRSSRYVCFVIKKQLADFTRAQHSIDTAILRTSHDIYCEAYDLMVKKNRFVHVKSQGVPQYLLNAAYLPVVTAVTDHVNRFRGYVLKVTMAFPADQVPELQSCAQDFFDMIGGLSLTLDLGALIILSPETPKFEDSNSLERWSWSEKNQKKIIQPFYDSLKDFENVRVGGLVLVDIVDFFSKRAASNDRGSPQNISDYLEAQYDTGRQQLATGKDRSASNLWMRLICEMNMVQRIALWPQLVQEGGEPFLPSLAALYVRSSLNCAILCMNAVGEEEAVERLVANCLEQARVALSRGRWQEGYSWRPPEEAVAALHSSGARFLALKGNPSDIPQALIWLKEAIRLIPDDPKSPNERTNVLTCCHGS